MLPDQGRGGIEVSQLPPIDILREVARSGERIVRREQVLLQDIVAEGIIIDEQHANDLGREMLGPWSQTQPVLLRARIGGQTNNDVVFDVLDGFHRVEGIKSVKPTWKEEGTTVYSTVLYGCSDEEMYDQRILAANSVKSVKYARVASWMKGAWAQTPWREKLTVTQAFGLTQNDSSGRSFGLNETELDEVKEWVRKKAQTWLSPIGTIYQNLRTVDAAAPDLVLRVRIGSFGKGQLALTPSQLEAIVETFPLEYDLQRRVAGYATSESLSTEEIRSLLVKLRSYPEVTNEILDKELKPGKWNQVVTSSGVLRGVIYSRGKEGPSYNRTSILRMIGQTRNYVVNSDLPEELKLIVLAELDAIKTHLRKTGQAGERKDIKKRK